MCLKTKDVSFSEKPERRFLRNRITSGAVKKSAEYGIWKEKDVGADKPLMSILPKMMIYFFKRANQKTISTKT